MEGHKKDTQLQLVVQNLLDRRKRNWWYDFFSNSHRMLPSNNPHLYHWLPQIYILTTLLRFQSVAMEIGALSIESFETSNREGFNISQSIFTNPVRLCHFVPMSSGCIWFRSRRRWREIETIRPHKFLISISALSPHALGMHIVRMPDEEPRQFQALNWFLWE